MKIFLACLLMMVSAAAMADSFSYDDSGRLETADQSNGLSHSYGYDGEGNLLTGSSSGADAGTANGIADWWENFYFGTTGINALASAAGDGVSNLTKFALGLNPLTGIPGQLVSVSQQVFNGQTYKYLTFTRSIANAPLVSLEQSADQVNWFGGSAYFALVSATDLGDGTEQVTYRSLTPLPNSLYFRLTTNGGSPSLLAYNTISSGTGVPAVPWWVFAVLVVALPLVAGKFLRGRGARAGAIAVLLGGSLAQADWSNMVVPPGEATPASNAPSQETLFLNTSGIMQGGALGAMSATTTSPELQALASALNNDPVTIFNYVHNKIEYQPYWGSHKGAQTTYLDGAGNDMDQCSLLIALLNQAGYLNTSYVYGRITIENSSYWSGAPHELRNWLGARTTLTPTILATAGIPASWNFGVVTLDHIWVRVVIGGISYDLDPSEKVYQDISGIDYTTRSGYSRSQLLADAAGTGTTDYARNLVRAAVESRLGQFSDTLRNDIKTNLPGAEIPQILGGRQIVQQTNTTLAQCAPWPDVSPTVITTFAMIPAQYIATLRVQIGSQIDITFNLQDLQGERLSLTFDATGKAQLWLGDTLAAQETSAAGSPVTATITAHHPFTSLNQPGPAMTCLRTGTYDLSYGFYGNPQSNGLIDASQRQLQTYVASGLSDSSREVLTESLHLLGLKWMRRVNLIAATTTRIRSSYYSYSLIHRILGRTGQESSYFVDMPGGLMSVFMVDGSRNVVRDTPGFNAISFLNSAMEHGVIEQSGGEAAVSTVKALVLASDGGQQIFRATSDNFASAVSPNLQNYSGQDVATFGSLAADGSVLLLHQNARTTLHQWTGYGYANIGSSSVGMRIAGGYSGGFYAYIGILSGTRQVSLYDIWLFGIFAPSNVPPVLSKEPVNLLTGAYTMDHNDLGLGEQGSPRGLNFSRHYDGVRKFQSGALGNGWTHSCEGKVTLSSELDLSFGLMQPMDAAQTIVGILAATDFLDTSYSPKELMTGVLASNWTVNRITNNTANVQLGNQQLSYVSLPDGSWNPPPGVTTALTGTSGSFVLQPRFGGSVTFDAQNRVSLWKDVDNNTQTYAYDPATGRLATVTDSQNRVLTFTYVSASSPLIQTVSDGTGRTVTYSYTGNNLTGIQDAEGYNTTFVYNSRNLLEDWKDHSGTYVTRNTYDAQDRVDHQLSQGLSSHLWKFLYSPGMTQEVDPSGNTTAHYFDSKNRLVQLVDALGNTAYTHYDGQNHVTSTVDATGRETKFDWDGNQNLTFITDPSGKITKCDYDGSLRLWKITDPTNRVTEFGYDAENHPTDIKDPGLRTTHMTYWPDGTLHEITDPDNKKTTFTAYDQWANPTDVTRADGTTTHAVFNARGDRTSFTDGRGKTTQFGYDKRRLPTSRTDPYLRTSHWTYDSNGSLYTSTDRRNKITTTVFDNLGHLQTVDAPDTGTVTMGYDERDLQTTVTDGLNHTTTFGFDIARRPKTVMDALGITVSDTILDGTGRVSERKNGLLKSTKFFYDTAGRLDYTLDPLNRKIKHTYDDAGRPSTLVNRRSQTFQTDYGTDGLPTTFTYPSARQSRIVDRDAVGRPKTLQDPAGRQTVLSYDGMGRVKTQDDAVGSLVWLYDNEGNQTDLTEGTANIHRTFDGLGRVLTCTDTSGNTVTYTYDNEGNPETIVYPGNKTVTYTYDGSNRLKTLTDWAGRLTTYFYDDAGRLTEVDRPNGTRQRIEYDDANRLQHTYEEKGAASLWQAGYGFDDAYRLTSYTPTPITKTLPPPPATMTYDSDNRLATYNGQTVASDDNGNLLSTPVSGTLLGALTWDARNRLLTAGGITYVYDAENRRVTSTTGNQTTSYTWSRGGKLDRLLVKTNPDGSVTRYIYGLGLIYEETTPAGGGTPTTQYYHYNWQGSTVALSDGTGTVTARMSYSPYGERTVESGTVTTPFCFNGQFGVMTEPNSLLTMQARFYSPVFRRFLNEDPAGFSGGINLYAYTGGDPVNLMDPFGLGPQGSLVNDHPLDFTLNGMVPSTDFGKQLQYLWNREINNISTGLNIVFGNQQPQSPQEAATADAISKALMVGMAGGPIGSTGKIGEAALQQLGGESQVFFNPSQGGRYIDQLVGGIANEAKVGYVSLTLKIRLQVTKDIELMQAGDIKASIWNFYRSPITGMIGPSEPLSNFLIESNIPIVLHL